MIDLYYWPTPNGFKITIMLEECGLPYKIVPVNIGTGEQFKPDFLKISPNNRMPAIVDHEPADKGAPCRCSSPARSCNTSPKRPASSCPRTCAASTRCCSGSTGRWVGWARWQARPTISMFMRRSSIRREALKYGQDRYSNEVNRLFGVLNKRLADHEFVAGAISIADFAIWPWCVGFKNFGQKLEDFPNLKRWFDKSMGERPAVVKGKAVGLELRPKPGINTDEQRRILFGQTAQVVR